jgi:hypothetical protein
MKTPRTLLAALAGGFVASATAAAQTTVIPVKDDVVQLSPFEVSAEKDTGYRASDTLAGTRLRTNLRDVAASIQVVTKDFMNDIAVNDLEGLLTYTAGTEIEGLGGNFSGSGFNSGGFQEFNGASRRVQSEIRVRGLGGGADQTRDYFPTDAPMDSYNVDRVEVNRGPNAILFGLGKPGGIVNSGLIKAMTNRTKTRVDVQFDDQSSKRLVFDHNQVLIKDVLALRFAALLGNKRFQIKPAHSNDERYFLTGTSRPWKGANLRVSTEQAKQKSNRPYTTTPMDAMTWWLEMGKPVYNPITNLGSYLGTPSTNLALRPFDPLTGADSAPISTTNRPGNLTGGFPQNAGLSIVGEDPNSSRLGITGLAPSIQAMEFGATRARLTTTGAYANGSLRDLGNPQEYVRQTHTDTPLLYNFWRDNRLMDSRIFDFYHHSLDGPNKREWAFWDTFNASFSQDLGRNAGVEVAYDWQRLDNGYVQPLQFRQNTIAIDINTHLMNGMPNPNLGRPMVNTAYGQTNTGSVERDAWRASAYYKLDFTRGKISWLAKLLGRHVFTGSHSDMKRDIYSLGGRLDTIGTDYGAAKLINSPTDLPAATATNPNRVFSIGSTERQIMRLSYHGPSLVNATSLAGYSFQGVTALQNLDGRSNITALYYERPPNVTTPLPRPLGAWKSGTFSLIEKGKYDLRRTTTGGSHDYEKTASQAFVSNNYWWDDTIVSTLGWRWDSYKAKKAGNAPETIDGLKNIDPAAWLLVPSPEIKSSKFNYGLVMHTPPFLRGKLPLGADISVSYNSSDNFSPTNQRFDIYNSPLAPTSGKTEEWSVLLSLFSNKLQLRAIKFETSQIGASAGFTEIQNRIWRRMRDQLQIVRNTDYRDAATLAGLGTSLAAWDAWEKSPSAQVLFNTYSVQLPTTPNGPFTPVVTVAERITDVVATQDQIAKGYEFEMTYNPTPQWRISLNAAEQLTINDNTGSQVRSMLNAIQPVWAGTAGALPLALTGVGNLGGDWTSIDIDVQKQELLDGGPSPEQRRWRFNAVTNYTFKGGKLDNVRIGGAYRWQDKVAIGYPIILGPDRVNGIIDVQHPYYGPAETNVDLFVGYKRKIYKDKVMWNVQLNVRNVGKRDYLIPVSAQPDGTIDTPRIGQAQSWTLTNTFEF